MAAACDFHGHLLTATLPTPEFQFIGDTEQYMCGRYMLKRGVAVTDLVVKENIGAEGVKNSPLARQFNCPSAGKIVSNLHRNRPYLSA